MWLSYWVFILRWSSCKEHCNPQTETMHRSKLENMKKHEITRDANRGLCALQTFNCNGLQGFFWEIQNLANNLYVKLEERYRLGVSNVFCFFHSIFCWCVPCQKMPTQMARVLKMIFFPWKYSLKVNFSFLAFFTGKNLVWKALCPTVWRNRWNEKSWRNCWVISWKWIRIWQLLVRKIWQLYKQSYTTSKLSASCPAMVPNAFQPLSV